MFFVLLVQNPGLVSNTCLQEFTPEVHALYICSFKQAFQTTPHRVQAFSPRNLSSWGCNHHGPWPQFQGHCCVDGHVHFWGIHNIISFYHGPWPQLQGLCCVDGHAYFRGINTVISFHFFRPSVFLSSSPRTSIAAIASTYFAYWLFFWGSQWIILSSWLSFYIV